MNWKTRLLASAALIGVMGMASAQAAECVRVVGPEWGSEKQTPDPAVQLAMYDLQLSRAIFDPFVTVDDALAPVPFIAESWSVNDDGTVWTFKVHQGIKFHDGSDLDSADVVYSYLRIMDPATASPGAAELGTLKPEYFSAPDPATVVVTLPSPSAELPLIMATKWALVVPEGSTTEQLHNTPVGSGPFTLPKFELGSAKIVVQKNPNYWREGLPKADCLEMSGISEPTSRTAALIAGEADVMISLDAASVPAVQGNPEVQILQGKGGTVLTLSMFVDTPPFDDVRVRKALKMVVDRQAILDTALLGYGVIGNDTPIPTSSPDAWTQDTIPRDVAGAKALLAEAGYADGLTVDLYTGDIWPGALTMAQAYQQMAADAGITVNLITTPAAEFWDVAWLKQPFVSSYWGQRPPVSGLSIAYRKTSEWRETHWDRPDYEALLDKAAATVDDDARREVYKQVGKMLAEEGGVIVPVVSVTIAALRNGCSGWGPPTDQNRQDFSTVMCE
jgi:peptide/nickel transport system substrate-binding protein